MKRGVTIQDVQKGTSTKGRFGPEDRARTEGAKLRAQRSIQLQRKVAIR